MYLSVPARRYESEILLEDHEAVTGSGPHDTRMCEGDSGGPLMRVGPSGEWLTYGVAAPRDEVETKRDRCEYGSVFATFGPVTFEFLEDGAVLSRCETTDR